MIEQQHRFTARPYARVQPRCLDLHERDEAMDFGLLRGQFRLDAAQAKCVFAERRAHPVFTGRRGVTFVEDEVDHFKNG